MSEKAKKKLSLPSFGPQDIVTLLFAAAIFIINYRIVGKCYNPFVYNDEMGYWTHAAKLAGLDWTGVSSTLAWYSFGYSFMLAPLIVMISDTVALYRTALILNIIMDIACYLMFVYIIRKIFPDIGKIASNFAAAAAIFYTSYQMNAGIAYSETALLFITTLVTFFIVRMIQKPTYVNMTCLGLLCAYLYMVHNRTIGIVASAVLIVAVCLLLKKVTWKKSGAFALALAVGFIANKLIKKYLETALRPSGKAGGNDAGSMVTKIKTACSSAEGMKKLLSIMAGQGFAVSAGTLCLVLFAVLAMSRHIITALVKTCKAVKEKKSPAEAVDGKILIVLFILCAFISSWLISSIFMFDCSRIDHILYTRYFDITVGLLIMTGICYLCSMDKFDIGIIMLIPVIMKVGATRAKAMMPQLSNPVFNKICSPGVCKLYEENGQNFHAYLSYSVGFFFIMAFIAYAVKKKKLCICVLSLICIYNFHENTPSAVKAITANQNAYEGDRALIERVRDQLGDEQVSVMVDTGTFISFLQYEMNDVKVDLIYSQDELPDSGYIFANRGGVVDFLGHDIIDFSDRHILYSAEVSEDSEDKIPLEFMNVFDADCYLPDEDAIVSSDNSFVCYGPYMHLDADKYTFTLDMDISGDSAESIGFAEVKSNSVSTVYAHEEITADMIDKDGSVSLDLGANVGVPVSDMEIVVFLYDPQAVSMQLNSIEVNTED